MLRKFGCTCAVGLLLLASHGSRCVEAQTPGPLVIAETGQLPIILSAPHGGGMCPRFGFQQHVKFAEGISQ